MTQHPPYAPARTWLVACYLCVFLMVLIGGLTRLTESGLSIVEWKPVTGALPPLTTQSWEAEFAAYKSSPQYVKVNKGMTLGDFQNIYWLEYIHRLMGRITGFVFLLPLLYYAAYRRYGGWLMVRMAQLTVLVGAQGAIGWFMVKSGLVDAPYVSPFRLALHLFVAFTVGALLVTTAIRWREQHTPETSPLSSGGEASMLVFSFFVLAMVMLQILLGALVAGYDAGLAYNTFPLMDGQWIPEGVGSLSPWYSNLFHNTITVQFQHRVMAFVAAGLVLAHYIVLRRSGQRVATRLALIATCIVIIQMAVGILTLIHIVPTGLASLHQMIAFLLFSFCAASTYLLYSARRNKLALAPPPHRGKHVYESYADSLDPRKL